MGDSPRRSVVLVQEWMPSYRVAFFEALRDALGERGIELSVVYGDAPAEMASRAASRGLRHGRYRRNRAIAVAGRRIVWQPWSGSTRGADLVVVNEGARLLLNYVLLARQLSGGGRVAFWGHGAHFDPAQASRGVEWGKRYLYRLPHWWFAYTKASRDRLVRAGVPVERITVAQNTISTEEVHREVAAVGSAPVEELHRQLGAAPGFVGLFLGSLYRAKRLDYLIEAADAIHAARPGFRLAIAGDGPDRGRIARMAESRPYVRMFGRVDGGQKAALLKAATVLLLPGAAGLAVLDGFASGTPVVGSAVAANGPELEYLEDGRNGLLLGAGASSCEYASAVCDLLDDRVRLSDLERGARRSSETYTQAAMVRRFSAGVEGALA